ncbi:MAG: hypothetical protein ACK56F_00405, partial [bacterium]
LRMVRARGPHFAQVVVLARPSTLASGGVVVEGAKVRLQFLKFLRILREPRRDLPGDLGDRGVGLRSRRGRLAGRRRSGGAGCGAARGCGRRRGLRGRREIGAGLQASAGCDRDRIQRRRDLMHLDPD